MFRQVGSTSERLGKCLFRNMYILVGACTHHKGLSNHEFLERAFISIFLFILKRRVILWYLFEAIFRLLRFGFSLLHQQVQLLQLHHEARASAALAQRWHGHVASVGLVPRPLGHEIRQHTPELSLVACSCCFFATACDIEIMSKAASFVLVTAIALAWTTAAVVKAAETTTTGAPPLQLMQLRSQPGICFLEHHLLTLPLALLCGQLLLRLFQQKLCFCAARFQFALSLHLPF